MGSRPRAEAEGIERLTVDPRDRQVGMDVVVKPEYEVLPQKNICGARSDGSTQSGRQARSWERSPQTRNDRECDGIFKFQGRGLAFLREYVLYCRPSSRQFDFFYPRIRLATQDMIWCLGGACSETR